MRQDSKSCSQRYLTAAASTVVGWQDPESADSRLRVSGLRYNLGTGIAAQPSLAEDHAAGTRRLLKEPDLTAFAGRNPR
jgi:hypothetical protein